MADFWFYTDKDNDTSMRETDPTTLAYRQWLAPHQLPEEVFWAVLSQVRQYQYEQAPPQVEDELLAAAAGMRGHVSSPSRQLRRVLRQMIQDHYYRHLAPLLATETTDGGDGASGGGVAYLTVESIGERVIQGPLNPSLPLLQANLPAREQIAAENYQPGHRLPVCVLTVKRVNTAPLSEPGLAVVVSRRSPRLVRALLAEVVPGFTQHYEVVSLKRQAGVLSKVTLRRRQAGVRGQLDGEGKEAGSVRKVLAFERKAGGGNTLLASIQTPTAYSGRANLSAREGSLPAHLRIEEGYLAQVSELLWGERLEILYLGG